MRAFQAALELRGRRLEPSTNFWQAGGNSLAASLVRAPLIASACACVVSMQPLRHQPLNTAGHQRHMCKESPVAWAGSDVPRKPVRPGHEEQWLWCCRWQAGWGWTQTC